MPLYDESTGSGLFLPLTQLIDIQAIYSNQELSEDLKQIMIRIVQAFNEYAQAINLKNTGIYDVQEFVTGQVYFPNPANGSISADPKIFRQVARIVVDFGALPNNKNQAVPHGLTITADTTFTAIYATATNTTAMTGVPIPITFVASGNIIDLRVDATNVNIQTNFNATAFNVCYVVIEFIQE
jgi:hypothetical protein